VIHGEDPVEGVYTTTAPEAVSREGTKGDDARAEKLYENVEYVSPQDIANIVLWLNQQPEHVNINRIEVMPTAQTFAPLNVARIQK